MEHQDQAAHKRRVRYKGTHPKSFNEKYKELQPEKYPETVARVIQKGSTPVGMHLSICVKEILEFLQIKPGQTGLDCTLGYGGHTQEMLKCLEGKGRMYAIDVDSIELAKTKARLEGLGFGPEILTVRKLNFAQIDQLAPELGPVDFVLADLGVSSMQIDNPERGFSYKKEGPLDLRLDAGRGISAAERLKDIGQEELEWLLLENADEPYAREISRAVVTAIKKGVQVDTTQALRRLIEAALSFIPPSERGETVKKSCRRTFQALRIDVNSEYEALCALIEKLPNILAPGGRVAILTFHSGEDRIVKKLFKDLRRRGLYSQVADEVIRPSAQECSLNSRARSAKLRWAIK